MDCAGEPLEQLNTFLEAHDDAEQRMLVAVVKLLLAARDAHGGTARRILLVDEDPVERAWGMVALAERYDVYLAAGTADAQARLGSQQVDLVVTTSDGDGFALVEWLRAHHPGLPCLVTTGGVTAKAVAMRRRLPYVMRPLDKERLLAAVARVLSEK